ncbi:MAG TPA: XdhC/CoxI family protein [Pyrinomonadaceae bacterium]|jgi:xanthine/CO dehydrogenase XdhC/CoxF family maturation factor|nr:XdhC/CoxI family protein [Pyrinomonadaceae bacterium]
MNEAQMIVEAFGGLEPGKLAALATVVSVEGSSYRRPGARMLIKENGETTGALSAGCFEQDVCDRAAKVMSTGDPVLVKYDTTSDDDIVWGLGLGCNGVVRVLIEPANNKRVESLMQLLAECSESSSPGAIATVFHVEGDAEMAIGTSALMFPDGSVDGQFVAPSIFEDLSEAVQLTASSIRRYEVTGGYSHVFIEVVQPRVRLVVFGAGFDVLPIVDLAANLGWHTTVVDTRSRASSFELFRKADAVLLCQSEDVLSQVSLFECSIVVVMTHNYLQDLEVLRQLLTVPLGYLGCLGPRRRTERLVMELSDGDIHNFGAALRRLHAPIGLDIGAETPPEIALSIVSEIKAVLSARTGTQLRKRGGSIHDSFSTTDTSLTPKFSLPVAETEVGLACKV